MKLYRVNLGDRDIGRLVEWFGNKVDAERRLRHWQRENGTDNGGFPESIEAVSVPTDKAGLIRWLNANLGTDNS